MKILVICSEDYSFSDSPLARAVGYIVSAYKTQGIEILGFVPYYNRLLASQNDNVKKQFEVIGGGTERVQKKEYSIIKSKNDENLFVRADDYFGRDGVYGDSGKSSYNDNHLRFAFLTSVALDWCIKSGFQPDYIHCHEWSGVAGALAKGVYKDFFGEIPVFLTIHNIKYDCYCNPNDIPLIGLPPEGFNIDGYEFWGKVSFLKAAILYADKVAFTSISYLFHLLSSDLPGGIRGFLESCKPKLFGIQNGIDYEKWDNWNDTAELTMAKKKSKAEFRKQSGLSSDESMLMYAHIENGFGNSSQVISTIIYDMMKLNLQLALRIHANHPAYSYFAAVSAQHKGKIVLLPPAENEAVLHERMLASDLFFTINLEEPSAVILLKSFAVGALVLTNRRSKRPLIFTIPYGEEVQGNEERANSFVADDDSPDLILNQIRTAEQLFHNSPTLWGRLISNAAKLRITWQDTAEHYLLLLQHG
ncbi:glycogen synthase [Fibrobacterales bacterium]|nr:glycogen synthase [Fibrobacterales bacterium]